jgi:hypothetical protein
VLELSTKPDLSRTLARFDAFWSGEMADRPPISAWVSPKRRAEKPVKQHASLRERWLDAEFQVDSVIASLTAHDWPLDQLPVYMPNVGPEITGALFGCDLEFGEHTSWSKPIVHEASQWPGVATDGPDFGGVYWQTIEKMTMLALERGAGRILTGVTDLHGNLDILASLREPVELCLDVVDVPEAVGAACERVAAGYVQSFNRLWDMIRQRQNLCLSWLACPHAGPMYIPSCDFWCMLSGEDAERLAIPAIRTEMAPLERSIFHLDGPQALRHLDLVLNLPGLNAVQWVYGAGQGPAGRWVEVYKRIRAAGKGIRLEAETPEDALGVLAELGSGRGVWLSVAKSFDCVASALAFAGDVERVCAKGK